MTSRQCLAVDSVMHSRSGTASSRFVGDAGWERQSCRGIELAGVIEEIPQEAAIAYMTLELNQAASCAAAADGNALGPMTNCEQDASYRPRGDGQGLRDECLLVGHNGRWRLQHHQDHVNRASVAGLISLIPAESA